MMTSTIQTPLHKRFETKCPEVCNLPPAWAAFLLPGKSRRNGGLYGIFLICNRHFTDPRYCARRWPWRVGVVNLLEGYGSDNPGSKSQGMKQLMAGGGIIVIGTTLIPLLSGLF